MALIKIKTDNPNFSFCISKNPASGMIARTLRKGTILGWFNNDSYFAYFKDADDEVSFGHFGKESDFEYNDINRYTYPMVYVGILKELFHGSDKNSEHDIISTYNTTISMLFIKRLNVINLFNKYFKDSNIELTHLSGSCYTVNITQKDTWSNHYSFLNVFLGFILEDSSYDIYFDELYIKKMFRFVADIKSPYFIRYWLKIKFIKSEEMFLKLLPSLTRNLEQDVKMTFSSTAYSRKEFMKERIDFTKSILDIGCNDMGNYGFKWLEHLSKNEVVYHAIDIDEACRKKCVKKAQKLNMGNLSIYESLNEYIETSFNEPVQVVLAEVIEHMELEDAKTFIKDIIKKVNWTTIIISTPNKDFNVMYNFADDDIRHEDHKFELTTNEFVSFVQHVNCDFSFEIIQVGDIINNIGPTQFVVFTK